ncbi:hypothetical protein H0X32_04255 [Patescibacteria group bacterium]|jgi:hypothetical protein|nr:hypothetical protein [Patescibacteria group bacterium]
MPDDKDIYQATFKALTESGVPHEVADRAAQVVGQDDFTLANLGRTPQDQDAIAAAMDSYWKNQSKDIEEE